MTRWQLLRKDADQRAVQAVHLSLGLPAGTPALSYDDGRFRVWQVGDEEWSAYYVSGGGFDPVPALLKTRDGWQPSHTRLEGLAHDLTRQFPGGLPGRSSGTRTRVLRTLVGLTPHGLGDRVLWNGFAPEADPTQKHAPANLPAAHAGRTEIIGLKDRVARGVRPARLQKRVSERLAEKHASGQHDQKLHGNRARGRRAAYPGEPEPPPSLFGSHFTSDVMVGYAGSGINSPTIHHLSNGQLVVVVEKNLWDEAEAHNEVLAYRLARILGDVTVPQADMRPMGQHSMATMRHLFVDDVELPDELNILEYTHRTRGQVAAGVLDFLMYQRDRHPMNWLMKGDEVVLVDNGNSSEPGDTIRMMDDQLGHLYRAVYNATTHTAYDDSLRYRWDAGSRASPFIVNNVDASIDRYRPQLEYIRDAPSLPEAVRSRADFLLRLGRLPGSADSESEAQSLWRVVLAEWRGKARAAP